jgi:hypothetical protein
MESIVRLVPMLILSLMIGCTIVNGTSIVTGKVRDPISADDVRIYRVAPENYEEIAIVTASAGHDFKSNESLIDSTVKRLKEEAAKVGANGVLLSEIDERDAPSVTTSYGSASVYGGGSSATAYGSGVSVGRGDDYSRIRGLAIYVPDRN